MKTIYSMGKGKFIHLDSYVESHKTRRSDVIVGVLAIAISTLTVGAMLGIDITSLNHSTPNGQVHRTNR